MINAATWRKPGVHAGSLPAYLAEDFLFLGADKYESARHRAPATKIPECSPEISPAGSPNPVNLDKVIRLAKPYRAGGTRLKLARYRAQPVTAIYPAVNISLPDGRY